MRCLKIKLTPARYGHLIFSFLAPENAEINLFLVNHVALRENVLESSAKRVDPQDIRARAMPKTSKEMISMEGKKTYA